MVYHSFTRDALDSSSHSTSTELTSSTIRSRDPLTLGRTTSADDIFELELYASLGDGPMRFGPVCRGITVQECMQRCSRSEIERFIRLKVECDRTGLDKNFTDEQIFRVAAYKSFSLSKSIRLLKHMDPKYIGTSAKQLKDQLRTKTLFPLPHLCTPLIDHFFYMKPSRYNPKETPTSTIIANLVYAMDTIYERNRNCKSKFGFIANMNDWTMEHFSTEYCFEFMKTLQGYNAPVHVDLFLIANPPKWFDRVWTIMKPMLAPSFRKKVFMIPEENLVEFWEPGFTKFLPDDLSCGKASTSALVEDFISFRTHVEESCLERASAAMDRSKPQFEPKRHRAGKRRLFRRQSINQNRSIE